MKNFKLTVQYDGTRYCGWQVQGNTDRTIQGKLQTVLGALEGAPVEVQGAGRTDAGVHARGQVASVRFSRDVSAGDILDFCAEKLPRDIAVISAEEVPLRFHARLNAVSKCYVYRLWNDPIPDVFQHNYLCRIPQPLDVDAMRAAALLLVGEHDFRSFCGLNRFKRSTVRTVYAISLDKIGEEVRISYVGDGFLNRMVRILTGTLTQVGLGERSPEEMPDILAVRDRAAAGPTMPAQGLCLDYVNY